MRASRLLLTPTPRNVDRVRQPSMLDLSTLPREVADGVYARSTRSPERIARILGGPCDVDVGAVPSPRAMGSRAGGGRL